MTDVCATAAAPLDVAVIGGGMAGAAAGYFLARGGARVTLIEAEDQPGYHTTGRSAAFYAESYGGAAVLPLTRASRDFLVAPPDGFAEVPLVRSRGALHLFRPAQAGEAQRRADALAALAPAIHLTEALPDQVLATGRFAGAIADPDCQDMDVAALHAGFLKGMARGGGHLRCGAGLVSAERQAGRWQLTLADGSRVASDWLVNAAGAWADQVAKAAGAQPAGLIPARRTIAVFAAQGPAIPADLPLILDFEERFYFKPEGAGLLTSPADETPVAPSDVQPDAEDIALAAARVEEASRWRLTRLLHKWAGLRCFVPDRLPLIGPDPEVPGFYWSAGQGGWGIQTAPAWGQAVAADLLGGDPPADLGCYRPSRLRT